MGKFGINLIESNFMDQISFAETLIFLPKVKKAYFY